MSNIWIFFGSILSSGVIAAIISASLTDAKERRILRREKIEEIYLNAASWLNTANSSYVPYLRVCEGRLTFDQALDLQIQNPRPEAGEQHLRMVMNIEMYENRLLPVLRAMETRLEQLNEAQHALRNYYADHGEASVFEAPFRERLIAFGKAGDDLRAAIIRRGTEIGQETGTLRRFIGRFQRRPRGG